MDLSEQPARVFFRKSIDSSEPLIGILHEVAKAHGATLAQIALAWVIHHPVMATIPGASSGAKRRQRRRGTAACRVYHGQDVTHL